MDKLQHEMYLNFPALFVHPYLPPDKLQHEMYLNRKESLKVSFRYPDKLQHEMYLNTSFLSGCSYDKTINFNMRCI